MTEKGSKGDSARGNGALRKRTQQPDAQNETLLPSMEDNRHQRRDSNQNVQITEDVNKRKSSLYEKGSDVDLSHLAHNAIGQAEEFMKKLREWKVCHFDSLPAWLQDNDYIKFGYRPPLPSFRVCFRSIFRWHTETVNIWTHLLGCIVFIGIALYFAIQQTLKMELQEQLVFGVFFSGAILCLAFSTLFHTVSCHSPVIAKIFSKLDYCGIAFLIMGSFIPWLYYGFYCHLIPKVIYLTMMGTLGMASITVSMKDKFAQPEWRTFRACVFLTFGLSAVFPAVHYCFVEGLFNRISMVHIGWLVLMGALYVIGAVLYAMRVPERYFPGKCDIWGQSHQIFHVFVLCAALVHYHGISGMASHRVALGQCDVPHETSY